MSRVFSPLRQLRPPAAAAAATGRRRRSRGLAQGVLRLERRPDLCGHPELQLRLQQPVQNSNAARQLVQSTQAGGALHGVLPTLGGQTDRDRDCPGQLGFHHLPEVHRHIARHSPPRPPVACVVQNASTGQQSAGGNRSFCPDLEVWTAHRGTRPAARGGLQPAATPAPAIPHPPDTPT